jgi:uncharacterized protein (DUF58 family)
VRKYLDPVAVSKLQNMQLRARLVVEGMFTGFHKSPYKGHSTDFAEYRKYTRGDEIKNIDWKVFAKVDRYYVKEFEEETSLSAWLILDTSASMTYRSTGVSKLEYGSYIAAALMYLMMKQQDSAGLVTFAEGIRDVIPPRRGSTHLNRMLQYLEEIQPGGETRISAILSQMGDRLRKRGLLVVLSDLLDEPRPILDALKVLRGMKNEVLVFHILDHEEIEFPFTQLMEFEDLETGTKLKVDCDSIRRTYRKKLEEFTDFFKTEGPSAGIDYLRVDTSRPFHEVLVRYLLKRNQVRTR